jgi:serine/threonine protein kinase
MVIVLFAPGQAFEGYKIKRVLTPEGEIQRYLVLVEAEGGQEAVLYCRIKKKAAGADIHTFREKLSALQALDHPQLPKIYGGDYAKGLFFWVAVAAPSGKSLRDALKAEPGPLPPLSAVALVYTLAETLDWAYDRGFCHFALSPDHIYVTDDEFEVTTILGLGIRVVLDAAPAPPRPDEFVYRAPEQIQKLEADYRADIHALGMILYELLAGDAPYADQLRDLSIPDIERAPDAVLSAFNNVLPTRLCERIEGLDSNLERLVRLMSARSTSHRVPTWKHVLTGLQNVTPALALASAFEGPEERERIEHDLGDISLTNFIAMLPSSRSAAPHLAGGTAEEKPAPLPGGPPADASPSLSLGGRAPRAAAELLRAKRDEKPRQRAIVVSVMAMVTTLLWLVSTPAHRHLREPRGSSLSDERAPAAGAAAPHASTSLKAPAEPLVTEAPSPLAPPVTSVTSVTPVTAATAELPTTRRSPNPSARRPARPAESAAPPAASATPSAPSPEGDPCHNGPFHCYGADP